MNSTIIPHVIYLLSVWLHILSATIWIGGMFFLVLVVVPWLRRGNREHAGKLLRETGNRFRSVEWICFSLLLLTGSYNLWVRGVRLGSFVDPQWLRSPFGKAVLLKLLLFLVVLVVSFVHDFVVGPRATVAIETAPDSVAAQSLRKRASLLGRLNALLALCLLGVAVALVRGCAW